MIREKTRVPNRQYELIDKDGHHHGPFNSAIEAVNVATQIWPGEPQDPEQSPH